MINRKNAFYSRLFLFLVFTSLTSIAQQNLGGITGTVTDTTGAILQKTEITIANNETGLKKTSVVKNDGSYLFPDLPSGTYTVTFAHAGFQKQTHDQVLVQGNRTTTVSARLQPGGADTAI